MNHGRDCQPRGRFTVSSLKFSKFQTWTGAKKSLLTWPGLQAQADVVTLSVLLLGNRSDFSMPFNPSSCCDPLCCTEILKLRLETEKNTFGALQPPPRLRTKYGLTFEILYFLIPSQGPTLITTASGVRTVSEPQPCTRLCSVSSLSPSAQRPFYLWRPLGLRALQCPSCLKLLLSSFLPERPTRSALCQTCLVRWTLLTGLDLQSVGQRDVLNSLCCTKGICFKYRRLGPTPMGSDSRIPGWSPVICVSM